MQSQQPSFRAPVRPPWDQPGTAPWSVATPGGGFPQMDPYGQPSYPSSYGQAPGYPQQAFEGGRGGGQRENEYEDEFANEPPLLEELGIDVSQILRRIKSVAFFRQVVEDRSDHGDWDLGGPLAIVTLLGFFLALGRKAHFGALYGVGLVGCIGAWALVNGMSPKGGLDLYTVCSILGYGLLPMVPLAASGVVLSLNSSAGAVGSLLCVLWCTATASRFFEVGVDLKHQRWLIAYPLALLYACFALLTVF